MLVVGEKEASSGEVSVRKRGTGDQGAMAIAALVEEAKALIAARSLTL